MRENAMKGNFPRQLGKSLFNDKKNYIVKKSLLRDVEVFRMKRRSFLIIALLALMMFSSMVSIVPEEAEANPLTVVTINLQGTPPKVDVSPGKSGIVEITGEVKCIKYGPDQVKVFLQAQSETGGASIIPPSFVFAGASGTTSTEQFSVTTRVPQGYTFQATPVVTVSGTFSQGGLDDTVPPVRQILEIIAYYKLEVDNPPPQEIGPGEFVYFSVRIINVGNAEDTYEFEFENLKNLVEDQWTIATITPKTFLEDEAKNIKITAQAPQSWTIWINKVTPLDLKITSQQSLDTDRVIKYNVPLYVRQKGIYIPGFSPVFAIIGIGMVALVMGKRKMDLG